MIPAILKTYSAGGTIGSPAGLGGDMIPVILQAHRAGGTKGFSYETRKGYNSYHLANEDV